MATVTKGRTFVSGETVTPAKLNELVDLATVTSIVDADVSASAAIALSKLATGALPTAITVASANIVDETIVAGDLASGSVTQAKLASNVTTTGPAFRAYATGTTTITNNIASRVTLAAEDFDTASCFASSRFTPNVAGYYQFNFGIRMESITAANALLAKNGTIITASSHAQSGTYAAMASDLVYLNGTTDYVELWAVHFQGTANVTTATVTASQTNTFLSGFLARAA